MYILWPGAVEDPSAARPPGPARPGAGARAAAAGTECHAACGQRSSEASEACAAWRLEAAQAKRLKFSLKSFYKFFINLYDIYIYINDYYLIQL